MRQIDIQTEFITLGQFLKLTNCVGSGGHVKLFLQQEQIHVNGEKEHRRGKKLYNKDIVKINGIGEFQVNRIN